MTTLKVQKRDMGTKAKRLRKGYGRLGSTSD